MFNSSSSLRGASSPRKDLELANALLESAKKAEDPQLSSTICSDAETKLSHMKRTAKKALVNPISDDDRSLRTSAATAYLDLGKQWAIVGKQDKALKCLKTAESYGAKIPPLDQLVPPPQQSGKMKSTKDLTATIEKTATVKQEIPVFPSHIFAENKQPPTSQIDLPTQDERLNSTPQLAHCLGLLQVWMTSPDDVTDLTTRTWLKDIENDEDEKERLNTLASDLLRAFVNDEIKDHKAVAEVVCLASVLQKDNFRYLLRQFYDGVDQSDMLNVNQLEGLAQIVQGASPSYLDPDDLVKILKLLNTRLQDTHGQSPHHIYRLTVGVSRVLDAMADTGVKGLDREQLHEPLSAYLESLKKSSDPYMVFQAAYAFQALLYVPDNETPWQAAMRRTGKVIQGVSGLVSAAKAFDLNGFIDGLADIQQGLAGATKVLQFAQATYHDVAALAKGGQGFLKSLKEGLSFDRKQAWYSALRGSDTLLGGGRFAEFRKLVCDAPCRHDPAFQWGVCQRLGYLAANQSWDLETRRHAVEFLGDIYQNDAMWSRHANIKQWVVDILMQLESLPGGLSESVETVLDQMETNGDIDKQALCQACRRDGPGSYPLRFAPPEMPEPSLLDLVQNKPDVEGSIRLLRKRRLQERGTAVYIPPQAKASLQAPDDARFPLMDKMKEFLESKQTVFLLLGDSGSGKSTFNRELECEMWKLYNKKDGYIPLYISLPSITKPEHDLITKQLRKYEFLEPQIRELKAHRKFFLVCDGYDESQQTRNLYASNLLNQSGEWDVKMVISCRSEYIGRDYRDRFQPIDSSRKSLPELFDQAVITPFSMDQVRDYIKRYVNEHRPLWETDDYLNALDQVPSLRELVKNPFLLTLSLEVLPRMTDPGQHLAATRVTRVALYDQFVEQWLERSKRRLGEKEMSFQAKSAFESLSDEGFTVNGVDYLKRLCIAIFVNQSGNPVVDYSRFNDEGTWKAFFFSRDDEKMLLREACPLSRSANQYRFIHRSLLEYGLARAVFDPQEAKAKAKKIQEVISDRRKSVSSIMSFEDQDLEEQVVASPEQEPDPNSPLVQRSYVNEPSVLHFLEERVHQEPQFRQELWAFINHSKKDARWRIAAANAITILVKAGTQFNGMDLRGIRIPGADLSHGLFDSTQLQDVDMRKATLRNAWLFGANLSGTQMKGVQFGELPYLEEESWPVSCAYSPDGRYFAAGLLFGEVSVYTTSNWERLWLLAGHEDELYNIMFSPKGDKIVSASRDKTVRIWNVETGLSLHVLNDHSDGVWSAAFSPGGDMVVTCSQDKTVRLWDVETGTCRQVLSGHTEAVKHVLFSPSGEQVVSGSDDKTVRLWDVDTGICHLTLTGHTGRIRSMAFSPKRDLVASGSHDRTIRVWDAKTGDCRHVFSDHTSWIGCVAFSPTGDQLASGDGDCTLRLWDVEAGVSLHTLNGHTEKILCIVYSPNGDQVASGSLDKSIRIWDTESGVCRRTFTGHSGSIRSVVFSPRGDRLASGSEDSTARLWDVGTEASRHTLNGHIGRVERVAFSPTRNRVASGSDEGTVRLWDMETGALRHTLGRHQGHIWNIVFSPDGHQVASGGDYEVKLWDVETGVCRFTFGAHNRANMLLTFSPKGDILAVGNPDNAAQLWDVETGVCRQTLRGHSALISNIEFSPKGNQLATGGYDDTLRLWDVDTGACLHVLAIEDLKIESMAFSPKGDLVAVGGWDKQIHLWDTKSGVCRQTLQGHGNEIRKVVFLANGDQIASCSRDGTVRLWDVETGASIHTLSGPQDTILDMTYIPMGGRIACGNNYWTLQLWDLATGQSRGVIDLSRGTVKSLAWNTTPDATYLLTGGDNGSVRLFELTDDGDQYSVRMRWSSTPEELNMTGALLQDAKGLSDSNRRLAEQRRASAGSQ